MIIAKNVTGHELYVMFGDLADGITEEQMLENLREKGCNITVGEGCFPGMKEYTLEVNEDNSTIIERVKNAMGEMWLKILNA